MAAPSGPRRTSTAPVTFFEHQARARRATGRLVLLFVLAVIAVTVAVDVAVALAWLTAIGRGIAPYRIDAAGTISLAPARVPAPVLVWTTLGTLAVIGLRTLAATHALRAGGDAVARMVHATPVERGTTNADERQLLNVVDEMAIASGITVPRVYALRTEPGINAFAAGYAPNQAAIVVTDGALRQLTRDELQGVIGHEFSHVLNGDMRLNVRMIGVLAGILFLGEIGQFLMRSTEGRGSRSSSRSGIVLFGFALAVIGYVGLFFGRLIKAGVSRQREFLADASSVQFTRNPEGLAGALAVIASPGGGALVQGRHAETLSHMFFAQGVRLWWESAFATHPPAAERIQRIDLRFRVADYLARRRALRPDGAVSAAEMPTGAEAYLAGPAEATPAAPAGRPRPLARAVVATVGRPVAAHVDHAAKLLDALPAVVRDAANARDTAPALVLALVLDADETARKTALAAIARTGSDALAAQVEPLAGHVAALAPGLRLPLVSIALASLRALPPAARDALRTQVGAVIDAAPRAAFGAFALATIVRRELAPAAGRAEPVRYRSILEVAEDARLVLALLAHAGTPAAATAAQAFARGLATVALPGTLPRVSDVAFPAADRALGRLRLLAPFVKRAYLEACVATALADERVQVTEAELLRAIAITLGCPIPPILASAEGAAPA